MLEMCSTAAGGGTYSEPCDRDADFWEFKFVVGSGSARSDEVIWW
jgi:hypothetical protein